MIRDPFDGMSGDELDPQAAESDQLMALGMHETSPDDEEDDDYDDEDVSDSASTDDDEEEEDASDDLDKDGLEELEEMEQQLLQEEPVLDFAMVEEE